MGDSLVKRNIACWSLNLLGIMPLQQDLQNVVAAVVVVVEGTGRAQHDDLTQMIWQLTRRN